MLSFIYPVPFLPFVLSFRYITVPHFLILRFSSFIPRNQSCAGCNRISKFSKWMAVYVAGERMKTNDLTRSSRTWWNARAPTEKQDLSGAKRVTQCVWLSATDLAAIPFSSLNFSFRIQQELGKTAIRRVAWPQQHRSWRFDFTGHEFRKACRRAVNL